MLDINFWSLEPPMRIEKPPNSDSDHRRAVHETSPIHRFRIKISPPGGGEHQNRNHEGDKRARNRADRVTPFTQMPWSRAEAVADEEDPDEYRDGECYKGCYSGDGEECAGGGGASEDKTDHEAPYYGIEPDCVYGGKRVAVYAFDDVRGGEAVIACVGECDSGGGDLVDNVREWREEEVLIYHASLAHGEGA